MLWVANFLFPLLKICVQNLINGGIKFCDISRVMPRPEFDYRQGRNVYLLCNSDIVSSV